MVQIFQIQTAFSVACLDSLAKSKEKLMGICNIFHKFQAMGMDTKKVVLLKQKVTFSCHIWKGSMSQLHVCYRQESTESVWMYGLVKEKPIAGNP